MPCSITFATHVGRRPGHVRAELCLMCMVRLRMALLRRVSTMVFIPTATSMPRDLADQAPPSRHRPISSSSVTKQLVSNALHVSLEDSAVRFVFPIQRGFVKRRSLIGNILDVEYNMEAAWPIGARHAGAVLFDITLLRWPFLLADCDRRLLALEREGIRRAGARAACVCGPFRSMCGLLGRRHGL